MSLWRSIRQECETFSKNLQFEVGNGTRMKFCMMYGVVIVHSRRFLELFGFSSVKDSSIADVLRLSNGVSHWDVRLSRLAQDWELESLISFMDLIYSKSVKGEGMDRICWKPAKSR